MRRATAESQLDTAVAQSPVTLIVGLPRVGRTSFLTDWHGRRPDTRRWQTVAALEHDSGIHILDHVDERVVDGITTFVRRAETEKSGTRLVIAPIDLVTAHRLQSMLPGIVSTVEIIPLQLEELADQTPTLTAAAGPIDAMPSASLPTNRSSIDPNRHWLRGGFPDSLAADNDRHSLKWRRDMLQALLARDYSQWGVERSFPLGSVLCWLANQNGGEFDEASCNFAKRQELRSAIYVLERLGLVRRLLNFPAGTSASMGKKPKLFVRDSGILHALLGIETSEQLRLHKDIGHSFESYAGESLIVAGAERCSAQFYRGKVGDSENEIDLVLDFPSQNNRLIAIEFKTGPEQSAKKGFYIACDTLSVRDRFIVHSGDTSYHGGPVDRLDLKTAIYRVAAIAREG